MPHPFSGGWRRPSTRRMPRIVRDSGFRYFRPHVPGNWAVTVVNKSVLSSSVGNSIGSSPSSSATWMYDDMILFSSKRTVSFPQKQRSSETVFPIFLFFFVFLVFFPNKRSTNFFLVQHNKHTRSDPQVSHATPHLFLSSRHHLCQCCQPARPGTPPMCFTNIFASSTSAFKAAFLRENQLSWTIL